MVFQDYKIEGDKITFTRKELIEARDHYYHVACKFRPKTKSDKINARYGLYIGKAAVLNDMLKMFEPIDFV